MLKLTSASVPNPQNQLKKKRPVLVNRVYLNRSVHYILYNKFEGLVRMEETWLGYQLPVLVQAAIWL